MITYVVQHRLAIGPPNKWRDSKEFMDKRVAVDEFRAMSKSIRCNGLIGAVQYRLVERKQEEVILDVPEK